MLAIQKRNQVCIALKRPLETLKQLLTRYDGRVQQNVLMVLLDYRGAMGFLKFFTNPKVLMVLLQQIFKGGGFRPLLYKSEISLPDGKMKKQSKNKFWE